LNRLHSGILFALAAYGMWGLMPLYVHRVRAVPAIELLSHRVVWSFVLLLSILGLSRNFGWLDRLRERPGIALGFFGSAILLSINWFVYIWAIARDRVVDASLGYFINPLISVLLAVVVLKERLRPLQWAAVGVATLGVLWLTVVARQLPWIGLALAFSFGFYGLLRKTAALEALPGLMLETALLLPLAAGYLWFAAREPGVWAGAGTSLRMLLVAAGPVTAVPLLCFAAGARRIPLSLLGILQYLGPTIQLLLGVHYFHEPFLRPKLIGFALIWLAVSSFSLESLLASRAQVRG
jgi:chloramphenicol-sensitive protein RarD